uniref:ADP,ATP carrier protein n=1 Tax=Pyramimonas obovata TaxID=1411642 RepID=A0A7S0R728_9CHLO|mmetsp:Transcript_27245/g.59500  ORF Transcript_27245/g.59500 Transcript_27245/m.59500 type:complete len:463 (+) Transcript_27245:396-1784(+)|eukprot:CAMPEP_0118935884 /NCGR_PEP_ID=MMETSP1169-20130426/15884_1 /TAXON_ID=36882 /ORGANISM="Pyramimonas obovata, Strain CCMP722" /LENGTH=462 /DNA_ID=CAMNT_0006878959 /DNA_START=364 /DNA_END=1752 /DNA_ORIENTATION=+
MAGNTPPRLTIVPPDVCLGTSDRPADRIGLTTASAAGPSPKKVEVLVAGWLKEADRNWQGCWTRIQNPLSKPRDKGLRAAGRQAEYSASTSGQDAGSTGLSMVSTASSSSRKGKGGVAALLREADQRWRGCWTRIRVACKKMNLSDAQCRLSAGVASAVVARTCVAPLERIKLEHQISIGVGKVRSSTKALNLRVSLQHILKKEGFFGLWKGNKVNLLRTAPYKAMNFYIFDTLHDLFLRRGHRLELSNQERAVAGAAAGVFSALLFFPLDLVRTRLIADDKYRALGVGKAMLHIAKREGFGGLYRGVLPALISMGPNGAVFYGVYDWLKMSTLRARSRAQGTTLEDLTEDEQVLGTWRMLFHGAIAGAASEASTYPLDLVRRRLQVQTGSFTKRSSLIRMVRLLREVARKQSPLGLYAGLVPSILQVLPSSALGYFTYESTKFWLEHNFRESHEPPVGEHC